MTPKDKTNVDWTERFSKWLKKGKEEADKVLDMPWDIEVEEAEEENIITATHPKIPFPIMIHVSKLFANLYMDTGLPTDTIEVEKRMRLYKKLLYMNTNLNLMKTSLVGEEQRVVLVVDLDLACLNKSEFNNAVTAITFGSQHVIDALGLTGDLSKHMLERTAKMVSEKIMEGESKDDIMEFLIHRVGMEKEYADEFMKKILETIAEMEKKEEQDLVYIQ